MSATIRFESVWKAYPRWTAGSRTLRGVLARRVPLLVGREDPRWALRDVSLDVGAGESVGVIGQNGAGKSTLLRLASGLGVPTRGQIRVPPDTASVLTLGESFDVTLTGRENAYTAAIVAGMSRAQAKASLPAVLEFAELEGFGDAPMRTYSDGMKLRLAFGVVAQLEPQALLVDEVIAVGDLRFQAKCMERIREMRQGGASMVLASHNLEQIEAECQRAVWLQAGRVRAEGGAPEVIEQYRDAMRSDTLDRTPPPGDGNGGLELRRNRFGSQEATIDAVTLVRGDGSAGSEVRWGDPLSVRMTLRSRAGTLPQPIVGVTIHRQSDGLVCYDASTEADGVVIEELDGELSVDVAFDRLDLVPGDYSLDVGIFKHDWEYAYDFHWQAYPLRVTGRAGDKGVYRPPHHWTVA